MYAKPSFGGTFGWSKGACNAFSGARFFSLLPCWLGICLGILGNSEPGGSSCMWGCVKAPRGTSDLLKTLVWGHFLVVQRGSQRFSWGLIFHSSPMTARATFTFAQEQRTRRVQLHVGLRKGSPGEFACTQSLPLGALLDGPKGLATHFLRPGFSVFSHAGLGYV